MHATMCSQNFAIAAGPNGELAITSNGGDASEDNVFRLLDLNGDGDYFDSGETIPYAARSLNGFFPDRPRALAYRTPLADPAAVPEPSLIFGLLATGLWGYCSRHLRSQQAQSAHGAG